MARAAYKRRRERAPVKRALTSLRLSDLSTVARDYREVVHEIRQAEERLKELQSRKAAIETRLKEKHDFIEPDDKEWGRPLRDAPLLGDDFEIHQTFVTCVSHSLSCFFSGSMNEGIWTPTSSTSTG